MPPKKENKKPQVKAFKDGSNNWFYNFKHYTVVDGQIRCVAGGIEEEEGIEKVVAYCKRKKIVI